MDRATLELLLQEAESLLHRGEQNIAYQREVNGTLEPNPKLLVEIAKLRVQRAQRHLDRQREAVAALERAGQDATTAKRLLKISERALATPGASRYGRHLVATPE